MNKVEILICTEQGYLESMSKLLVSSLRQLGGTFKDVPIFSYQPRKQFKISAETIAFFEKNNVEYVDIELNKHFCHYPLANKPLACAHREMNTNADVLIFLDSDVFFLNEPNEFLNFEDADTILRPVDNKNIGARNSEDKNALYWNKLYALLDVKVRRYVTTTVGNEDIWKYYNSGHIATLTKSNLFNTWSENFLKVMDAGIKPDTGLFFVEQSVFSATVSQMELKVKQFSKEYNYPLPAVHKIANNKYVVSSFDSLVSIHYHGVFKNRNGVNPIEQRLLKTEKGKIINKLLNDFNILERETTTLKLKRKLLRWLFLKTGRGKTVNKLLNDLSMAERGSPALKLKKRIREWLLDLCK
jgi:hypothetical protein